MILSKSFKLSLLIKREKQIFEIHRNFGRIKLGNMNEKISEITKRMQTETWAFGLRGADFEP